MNLSLSDIPRGNPRTGLRCVLGNYRAFRHLLTGRFQVARLLEQVHRIDERLYHPERERDAHEGPRERQLRHGRVALRI